MPEISWTERVNRAQDSFSRADENPLATQFGSLNLNPEWDRYIEQPWNSLYRIHDRIFNDCVNFDMETRHAASGEIRRCMYEVSVERWKAKQKVL